MRSAAVDGYSIRVSEQPHRWVIDDDTVQVYWDEPYLDARWDTCYHDDYHNRPSERRPHSASIQWLEIVLCIWYFCKVTISVIEVNCNCNSNWKIKINFNCNTNWKNFQLINRKKSITEKSLQTYLFSKIHHCWPLVCYQKQPTESLEADGWWFPAQCIGWHLDDLNIFMTTQRQFYVSALAMCHLVGLSWHCNDPLGMPCLSVTSTYSALHATQACVRS